MSTPTDSTPAPAAAASGNQSVRQLAATLTKLTTAPSGKKEPAASAATAAEPAPAESVSPPAAEQQPDSDSLTTNAEAQNDATETNPEVAGAATEAAASPDAQTEEATAEAETEGKPELPAEVREAIEIAKAQDGGKGKAEMLKRIHKLTDARDTERNGRLAAEEQLTQLRQELTEAKTAKPSTPATPAGVHPAVHAVQQDLARVDEALSWCEEQLPRLQSGEVESVEVPDGKGGKSTATLRDVAKARRDLENQRQELVAKKLATEKDVKTAFDAAHQTAHQAALKAYPWVANPQSNEHAQMQQILKMIPGFKSVPDFELAIGDFLAGKSAREARAKAPAAAPTRKPAPAREPTRVATQAPSSGGEAEGEEKDAKVATQKFTKSGSTRDLARALTAKRQAGRTK